MKFCPNCNNMFFFSVNDVEITLEPTTTPSKKKGPSMATGAAAVAALETHIPSKLFVPGNKLIYYCRNCGNTDESIEKMGGCIYEKNYSQENQRIRHLVNAYTKFDITLPRLFHITCVNNQCSSNIHKKAWINNTNEFIPTTTPPAAAAAAATTTTTTFPETEVIFICYNDKDLKFVYLCVHCDSVWTNKEVK